MLTSAEVISSIATSQAQAGVIPGFEPSLSAQIKAERKLYLSTCILRPPMKTLQKDDSGMLDLLDKYASRRPRRTLLS